MKGYLLLGLAFVTCPCHLPLFMAVLAGTGLAGARSQHVGFAFVVLSVMLVTSLILGLDGVREGARRRT